MLFLMVNITMILYYMNYDDSQGMDIMIPVMIVMMIGVRAYWSEDLGMVTWRSGQSSAKAQDFSIGSTTS